MDRTDYPDFGDYFVRPAGGRDQSATKQLRNPNARDYVTLHKVLTLASHIEVRAAEIDAVAVKIQFRDASVIRLEGAVPAEAETKPGES